MATGGNFAACSGSNGCSKQIVERCGCDDTNGDGVGDVRYTEIWAIDPCGTDAPMLVGTWVEGDFDQPYTPVAPVDCPSMLAESPGEGCDQTTPLALTGLCLADGSPIAVTVERDCAGTITQTGWLDLTTGQWSAGAPPAGTVACGESRSIQVSGVFCDVLDDGTVAGLVLVEYQYADDGSIESVRLVDAATGDEYTLQGTLSVCPAGVQQPEQDLLELCDTLPDGTVVPFVRDYRRDENGTVTGFSDYTLDGAAYTPAGDVGACVTPPESPPEPCDQCQTIVLCDRVDAAEILPGETSGILTNGVGWSMTCGQADPNGQIGWWSWAGFPCAIGTPLTLTLDRPSRLSWGIRLGEFPAGATIGSVQMPDGTVPVSIHPDHVWDETTLTLSARPGAQSTIDSDSVSTFQDPGAAEFVFTQQENDQGAEAFRHLIGQFTVEPLPYPFLRTICRYCTGEETSRADRTLDGDDYVPIGSVGVCEPTETERECVSAVQVLRLCDLNPDAPANADGQICATPFLRHLLFDCIGEVTATRDTTLTGEPYNPVQVVDCGTSTPALQELAWPLTGITQQSPSGFTYTLENPQTGETATVQLTASSDAGAPGCAWTGPPSPDNPPVFNNPSAYTYVLDDPARAMDRFRLDFQDLDTFEGVRSLSPIPDDVQFLAGAGTWNGSRIDATENNSYVVAYWNAPPEQISHGYANTGGGNACHSAVLQGSTVVPGGCCGCPEASESPSESPGECRNTNMVLLCDVPTEGVTGEPTATDTPPPDFHATHGPLPGGGAALWAGGSVTFPAESSGLGGTTQAYRGVAATLTAPEPDCTDGTAHLSVSVRIANQGPDNGRAYSGRLSLFNAAGDELTRTNVPTSFPAGQQSTITVAGDVPAGALAAGDILVALWLETYHGDDGKTWVADQYTASYTYGTDGCETQFLRNITVDCDTGQVISVTDTTLDGDPYVASGDVGQCVPAGRDEPCRDTSTVLLCDVPGGESPGEPSITDDPDYPALDSGSGRSLPGGGQELWDGATLQFPAVAGRPQLYDGVAGVITAEPPACDSGMATVTATVHVRLNGPNPGMGYTGRFLIRNGNATVTGQNTATSARVGWERTLTLTAQVPSADLAAGNVRAFLQLETRHGGGKSWTADQFDYNVAFDADPDCEVQFLRTVITDCETGAVESVTDTTLDGQPYQVEGEAAQCTPATSGDGCRNCETLTLCDVPFSEDESPGESPSETVTFLRSICRDCDGAIVSVSDTTLDGEDYTPVGDVEVCAAGAPEECRNTSTLLVCDIPTADVSGEPTATDTQLPESVGASVEYRNQPGGGQALWDGGTVQLTPDTTTLSNQRWRRVSATLQAGRPGCDDGTATVTVSVDVERLGPDASCGNDGGLVLSDSSGAIAADNSTPGNLAPGEPTTNTPVGWTGTLTVSGKVSAEDLAAGNVVVDVQLETFQVAGVCPQDRSGGWELSNFQAFHQYNGAAECETQILATVVTDCETGQVESVTYTTMDGEPYTPEGNVGQCTPAGGADPCRDCDTTVLCDLGATLGSPGDSPAESPAEETFAFFRTVCRNCTGQVVSVTDTTLDGDPYEPVGPVAPCPGTGAPDCPRSFSTECVAVVNAESTYDNTSCFDNGECSDCGTISGPKMNPDNPTNTGPFFGCAGNFQVTSWIIDGEDVVTAAPTFTGTQCGDGPGGMHENWAAALSALDPGGTWEARTKPSCAWYVGTSTPPGAHEYGPMTITNLDDTSQVWILGVATFCQETPYTKIYTQQCDGTVTISIVDQAGNLADPAAADLVPCGACSGGGSSTDCQIVQVLEACRCDAAGSPGESPSEIIGYTALVGVDCKGNVTELGTYTPDLSEPYEPVNPVECPPDPGGEPAPQPQRQLVESCRCDDPNGDGSTIVRYVEVWSFDPNTPGAAPLLLGRFENGDYASPYTPVNPVDCPDDV